MTPEWLDELTRLRKEHAELRKKLAKVRLALVDRDGKDIRCLDMHTLYGNCSARWPLETSRRCLACAVREALA